MRKVGFVIVFNPESAILAIVGLSVFVKSCFENAFVELLINFAQFCGESGLQ
jgi:hypothetical protein